MILKLTYVCWDIFALFWLANLFFNKRTAERQTAGSRLRYWVLFVAAFWLLFGSAFARRHRPWEHVVLAHSAVLGITGLALALIGLCLALWARVILGSNWSGSVTFKENHELIVRGPYRWVRHPIYTGMLLLFLGTAIQVGTPGALLGFPLLFFSFRIKYRQEEALMIRHFGDQYLTYMRRVRALIPLLF